MSRSRSHHGCMHVLRRLLRVDSKKEPEKDPGRTHTNCPAVTQRGDPVRLLRCAGLTFLSSFASIACRTSAWEEGGVRHVENMYTVTALGWRTDGSRLAVGSLCGAVDVYDACVKRTRYKGRFELTYVSVSQVIVKRLSTGSRIVLKSQFGCEILKVNIYQDR